MALRREYVRLLSVKVAEGLQKQEMIGVPEGLNVNNLPGAGRAP